MLMLKGESFALFRFLAGEMDVDLGGMVIMDEKNEPFFAAKGIEKAEEKRTR